MMREWETEAVEWDCEVEVRERWKEKKKKEKKGSMANIEEKRNLGYLRNTNGCSACASIVRRKKNLIIFIATYWIAKISVSP